MAHINGNKVLFGNMRQAFIPYDKLLYKSEAPTAELTEQEKSVLRYAAQAYGDANGISNLQYENCYWILVHRRQTGSDYDREFYQAIAIPKAQYAPTIQDLSEMQCDFTYNILQGYSGTVKFVNVRFNIYGSSDLWQTSNAARDIQTFLLPQSTSNYEISEKYAYTNVPWQNVTLQYNFPLSRVNV